MANSIMCAAINSLCNVCNIFVATSCTKLYIQHIHTSTHCDDVAHVYTPKTMCKSTIQSIIVDKLTLGQVSLGDWSGIPWPTKPLWSNCHKSEGRDRHPTLYQSCTAAEHPPKV